MQLLDQRTSHNSQWMSQNWFQYSKHICHLSSKSRLIYINTCICGLLEGNYSRRSFREPINLKLHVPIRCLFVILEDYKRLVRKLALATQDFHVSVRF